MARGHNDANILCVGARVSLPQEIMHMADVFLEAPFEGGRHASRLTIFEKLGERP